MKHTQGIWKAFCLGSEGYIVTTNLSLRELIKNQEQGVVADCTKTNFNKSKADAQLISASPELYEALEYFYNISFDLKSSMEKGYIQLAQEKARKALEKVLEK